MGGASETANREDQRRTVSAELLGVPPRQAFTWLKAIVEQGALTKTKRPVRYATKILEKQNRLPKKT
jgi:hypothetical protein